MTWRVTWKIQYGLTFLSSCPQTLFQPGITPNHRACKNIRRNKVRRNPPPPLLQNSTPARVQQKCLAIDPINSSPKHTTVLFPVHRTHEGRALNESLSPLWGERPSASKKSALWFSRWRLFSAHFRGDASRVGLAERGLKFRLGD